MSNGREPERRTGPSALGNLPLLLIIILGIVAAWWLFSGRSSPFDPDAKSRPVTPRGELAADELTAVEIFEQAAPSVVHITTRIEHLGLRGFALEIFDVPLGDGSGFVWDEDGHVVTNFHVIRDARNIAVKFADGDVYPARLVGAAPDKDIAVLHIEAPAGILQPILIGESAELKVGQKVYAIGNPFGYDQSLSTGVVSAVGRQIESPTEQPIYDVIQTDAAINPGNSGGPLLDSAGRLIGMNTAIASPSRANAGVGFAIPVDSINAVVPLIIRRGSVGQPGLGIHTANAEFARRLGVSEGVLVMTVFGGSSASAAGLKGSLVSGRVRRIGDIILEINGEKVEDPDQLTNVLARYNVGDQVEVTLLRDGETLTVPLTLQSLD